MHHRTPPRRRPVLSSAAAAVALALALAACGSDAKTVATTAAPATTAAASTTAAADSGVTAAGISDARCAANKAAGKITYLSSFDFAASASIIDVVVAKEKGYFSKLCLDVDLKPSFSTANYPLVAANTAQFSSAGSYTEMLNYSKDGASFVALVDYGKTPIEALVVKDPATKDLSALKGKTIGVKGDIPPSIVAMLTKAGLVRGKDYKEVLLDGFDPVAQLSQAIDALPVYKSNEPGQLDAKSVKYALFDPTAAQIPGTFGLLYTSSAFAKQHPTATQDFIRAALKGMEDAVADPAAAVAISVKAINAAGNQNFLSQEGETFRWTKEAAEVKKGTPTGPIGLIDPAVFTAEVAAYVAAGSLKTAPTTDGTYDVAVATGVYGADGKVVFPA
jgi:NitT/TauT family transport system substrate-binding protein